MAKIGNSGCVSKAVFNGLQARRKGSCPWDGEIYPIKKNGERYAKPLKWASYCAATPEAEVERMMAMNPGTKYEIVRKG